MGVQKITLLAAFSLLTATAFPADVSKLTADLASADRDTRRNASHELLQLGAASKPALSALITALEDQDRQVWSNSIGALAAIGPDAKDAIPKLISSFDSRNSRGGFFRRGGGQVPFRAAYALAKIGEAAKPALLDALKSADTGVRTGAAKALGEMGARDAIPGLIENLGHSDEELRSSCVESLGLIGAPAVAPLISSLGWPDAKLREGSARALATIGRDAAPAGDSLVKMAQEEKENFVRSAVFAALPRTGVPQEKIVPPLIAALKGDSDNLRRSATNALLATRPAGKVVIPAVTALLKDPAHSARAIVLLGRFGTEAKDAVPALLALAPEQAAARDAVILIGAPAVPALLDTAGKLKPAGLDREHWAIKTLAAIGLPALPELQKGLSSTNPTVRLAAVGTLNELGTDARDLRPAVLALSGDPEPFVRATVLSALVSLGAKPAQALEQLESAIRDKAPVVRVAAATAAGALGEQARPLAPRLGELLTDPDPGVRIAALRAIGPVAGENANLAAKVVPLLADAAQRPAAIAALAKLGAKSAAPKLAELYPQSDKPARLAILAALGSAGEGATATLAEALKDQDAELRATAIRAYTLARPPHDVLIPALTTALADKEQSVRKAAAEASAEFGAKNSDAAIPLFAPLIALLPNEGDRPFALDSLRAIRTRNLDAITPALEGSAVEGKIWAIERLGRIGRDARPAREKIEAHLNSENDYVRRAARRALEAIGK